PLAEFQAEVLKSLNAKPVDPDAGKIGLTQKETKTYSLRKAILDMATKGRLEGFEKECHEAAMAKTGRNVDGKTFIVPEDVKKTFGMVRIPFNSYMKTANQASQFTAGGALVDTDFGPMIEYLRNRAQVVNAGATTIGGLVGDFIFP